MSQLLGAAVGKEGVGRYAGREERKALSGNARLLLECRALRISRRLLERSSLKESYARLANRSADTQDMDNLSSESHLGNL